MKFFNQNISISTSTAWLLCCLCFAVTAEIINPQCSKNVCVLPSDECVESCPRNQHGVYFTFGLRSNDKCAPSTPGKGLRNTGNDTSSALALTDTAQSGNAGSHDTKELAERQDVWPEYGPPNCFWGLCQFEGPPCILWCTEDRVYYGSNDGCKDRPATQNSAALTEGNPSSLAALTVFGAVLWA